jgi:pimeloyl-ACP methyl ester carboxylesterase
MTAELEIPEVGAGLLRRPDTNVRLRGGVLALHGASRGDRSQPLFDHLAETLVPLGYAVLSYDRRRSVNGSDVPFVDQAADARAALATLTSHLDSPVGLFGFSQGAWAACAATAMDADPSERTSVSFLVLLGCAGVSPAVQMRFFTDERLRRAGYDEDVRGRARELRKGLEETLRGVLDPAGDIARVTCPTLLIYGADEECVPASQSEAVWRGTGERDLTVVYLPRCGHFPVIDGVGQPEPDDPALLSPDYTAALAAWFSSSH